MVVLQAWMFQKTAKAVCGKRWKHRESRCRKPDVLSPVTVNGEMVLKADQERAYIFDHAWRQVARNSMIRRFMESTGKMYHDEYAKFLPHINNNYDFQELLSELLGELNASHTGGRYAPPQQNTDATASLGLLYDEMYDGEV